MNVGRLSMQLAYTLIGGLILAGWPSHARAQHAGTHALTSQFHVPPPDRKTPTSDLVKVVRESTERFREVSVAEAEGYALLFGCVSGPDSGGSTS